MHLNSVLIEVRPTSERGREADLRVRVSVTKISLSLQLWRSIPVHNSETAGSGLCLLPSPDYHHHRVLVLSKAQDDSG